MLKEKLQEYYGVISKIQNDFIDKMCLGYTEADEEKLFEFIIEQCPKNFGFPDISKLSKAFKAIPSSNKQRTYYCNVCSVCGTYYNWSMYYCPVCWNNGKKVSEHSVLVSSEKILDVKRYNAESYTDYPNFPSCYNCTLEHKLFCNNFGKPNFFCKEFRECACNACCVKHKKQNELMQQQREGSKENNNECENQIIGKRIDA